MEIINDLVNIIKYIPFAISEGSNPYCATFSSNCYHLEECLVKESVKMMYKNADEIDTKMMAPYFLGYKEISKAAHQRIKEKLYYVRE